MKTILSVSLLFVVLFQFISYSEQNELVVDTSSGVLEGIQIKTINEKTVNGFLGIPYAEPPVGTLRFKPPVKVTRSTNVLKAHQRTKACIQALSLPGSAEKGMENFENEWIPDLEDTAEDCLYLNLWVPSPKPKDAPVMVWIHGGAYEAGTANSVIYDGQLLATKDVIVVSMNYRLSAFGFLVLHHEEAPGNVGLMDQALALKWVQANIAKFGGNPKRVTIFGESAGAGSVGHHLLIPSSQGLFQKAILESGAATSPWSFSTKQLASFVAGKFVEAAGCLSTTPNDMVHCLREIEANKLGEIAKNLKSGANPLLSFNPAVDGEYYTNHPNILLAGHSFNKDIDILLGAQEDDGVFVPVIAGVLSNDEDDIVNEDTFVKYIEGIFGSDNEALVAIVKFQYTDWESNTSARNWGRSIVDFATDVFFKCSMNTLADNAIENGNNVYYYQFNHKLSISQMPKWAKASHAEELPFVFGTPFVRRENFTEEEVELSEKVMDYWTEFAKKGDPNGLENTSEWPLYTAEKKEILTLQLPVGIQHGMRLQHCAFVNVLLPQLHQIMAKTQAAAQAHAKS